MAQDTYKEAELVVGFRLFSERYVSRVSLVPGKSVVVSCLVRGTHRVRDSYRNHLLLLCFLLVGGLNQHAAISPPAQ